MADITKLSRLVNGLQRNVDLSANTIVTQSIKVGGPTINTELTKAILDNLVNLQNGSDAGSLHTHDARYNTKAALASSTASSGSDLVGDDATYTSSTPVAATVKGALSGLDTAIGAEVTRAQAAELVNSNAIGSEVTRATTAEGVNAAAIVTEKNRALAAEGINAVAVSDETGRAVAAEANLQSQITSAQTNLAWRAGAVAVTADAGLAAATDGDTLEDLLPFSDDEIPRIDITAFIAGSWLLSKNGGASKLWKVYNDAGTLKITDVGFNPITEGDSFVVKNDLPDSPASQEGTAIYNFDGVDLNKLADFDWSLADGIDLASGYVAAAGVVVTGDSVQEALAKLDGNISGEKTRALAAELVNSNAIAAEVTRATTAEGVNTTAIATERTRALAAELVNSNAITAEVTRAGNAEAALTDRVALLEDSAHSLSRMAVAGEALTANTSYLVRYALVGETVGRVYKADKDTTSLDKFYAFGIVKNASSVVAGGSVKVVYEGSYSLDSNDSPFSSSDIGKAVYLIADGGFSVAPPTSVGEAVWRIGTVEDTNKIWIGDKQLNGIN